MADITAQFIITDESLYSGGNSARHGSIKEEVIRRLRNRSAVFDRIVEAESRENDPQLNNFKGSEEVPTTLIDVTISVADTVLEQLEADQDLVFMKVISELENDSMGIANEWQRDNVSHIDFKRNS